MDLEFTKMHGLGNDFVVIDDLEAELGASTRTRSRGCATATSASAPTA